MKQVFLSLCVAAALIACNSSDTKTADNSKMGETKVAAMSTNELAYPVKDWADWQPGSMENLKIALQTLKDFERGDVSACVSSFADSIQKMFTADRKTIKAMEIVMDDYESVKSKDGKQEYVSMWYKQKWQDQKGNWDSLICMDDVKMVNGKIASLDEKIRHYPKKKM